jgi:hypothetical protein
MLAKQKFQLSIRSIFDPVSFFAVAGIAGAEQYQNVFPAYRSGIEGYGSDTALPSRVHISGKPAGQSDLPFDLSSRSTLLLQGEGQYWVARALYAISAAVIAKGDDGRWKPNYSRALGNFLSCGHFEFLLFGFRSRSFVSRLQWFDRYGRGCCVESDPRIPSETDHLACSPRGKRPTIGLPEERACHQPACIRPADSTQAISLKFRLTLIVRGIDPPLRWR